MVTPPPFKDDLFLALQAALAGRYSLECELGRGGMGIVFLARDVRLDRPVALKLLPPQRASNSTIRERFLAEARMAARLAHPNIVPIHAVEEINGFVFFAMQYVAGENLGDLIRRRGKLLPWDAAKILRDVAWALAYAHAQGVVHRDIKPDNILLDHDGRALVADFGIAQLAHSSDPKAGIQGTPEYVAPEQACGAPSDGRADLYALGAVGYHALTGRPPFVGDATELLAQHLSSPAPALLEVAPELPVRLASVVDRALLKLPDARWENAETMAEALTPALPQNTELPVPVRIWAERGREMKGVYVIWSLLFFGLSTMVVTFGRIGVGSILDWPIEMLAVLGFFVAAIPAPWIAHSIWRLMETRHAIEAGATVAELGHAAEVVRVRREEELQFDATRPIHWFPRLNRWATYTALSLAVLSLFGGVFWGKLMGPTEAFWGFTAFTMIGISGAVKGLLMPGRRVEPRDPWARGRVWFWRSPMAKLFAKAASVGLVKGDQRLDSWRPTETALGGVTETLFEALPQVQQRDLADLPSVVSRLEREAAHSRLQLDRGDTNKDWAGRLAAAVGSMETIRLGLLRMHAQRGEVGSLTADLDAARELADRIDLLVAADDELEVFLDHESQNDIQAAPSARPASTSLG